MNVFNKILGKELGQRITLGNPLGFGTGAYHARMNLFASLRGGKGFMQPSMKVKVGSERGNKRREARKKLFGLS